jgi:hypothetical protein
VKNAENKIVADKLNEKNSKITILQREIVVQSNKLEIARYDLQKAGKTIKELIKKVWNNS